MNRFLRGHRVLTVDKHYDDSRGLWTFAVTYIEGGCIKIGVHQFRRDARLVRPCAEDAANRLCVSGICA